MHSPHATESVLDLDLANDLVGLALDLLEELPLLWNDLPERFLEVWLRRSGIATREWNGSCWPAGSLQWRVSICFSSNTASLSIPASSGQLWGRAS